MAHVLQIGQCPCQDLNIAQIRCADGWIVDVPTLTTIRCFLNSTSMSRLFSNLQLLYHTKGQKRKAP